MKLKILIYSLVILSFMSSCADEDYIVVIHTEYGDMKALLYDETPEHKKSFLELVKGGYYDSLLFHRVIKGFMIQGGDPNSRNAAPGQSLGNGGPGYTIKAEINPKFYHVKGALSAARLPDNLNPNKESSGSQFYIVQGQKYTGEQLKAMVDNANYTKVVNLLNRMFAQGEHKDLLSELIALQQAGNFEAVRAKCMESLPLVEEEFGKQTMQTMTPEKMNAYETIGGAPHLDGDYTVFGRVVEGLDVIDKIADQSTGANDRPIKDIRMVIEVEQMSRKEITAKYGYNYPED